MGVVRFGLRLVLFFFVAVVVVSAGGLLYLRHCYWRPEEAAQYATEQAEKRSVGMCALYVRKAINAGGVPLFKCGSAWHYKYVLPVLNFHQVDKQAPLQVGDIVVFQPIGGRKYGHIALWNGKQWVSDFRQRNLIVHSDYTKAGAEYAIYRRE